MHIYRERCMYRYTYNTAYIHTYVCIYTHIIVVQYSSVVIQCNTIFHYHYSLSRETGERHAKGVGELLLRR